MSSSCRTRRGKCRSDTRRRAASSPRRWTACPSSSAPSTVRSLRFARRSAGRRVAYVQVQGGALPVSLSDTVRALRERGLLGVAIAVAPCLDGDVECVTTAAAFAYAAAEGYDAVVCSLGPGIVGHRLAARHRRALARGRGERRDRARRSAGAGRSPLGRRRARAPSRHLAPRGDRARALPRRGRDRRRRTPARAGKRPAPACRSATWAAALPRTRPSSARPTQPVSPRASCSPDGGAAPRPGRRARHLEHIRRRRAARTAKSSALRSTPASRASTPRRCTAVPRRRSPPRSKTAVTRRRC